MSKRPAKMPLRFTTLLAVLLTGLGIALLLSAIRPAATVIGAALLLSGCIGIGIALWRNKS